MNDRRLNVLSLQPWYGGSHRQFTDGWSNRSRHQWTTIGLPNENWKWRMRHAAIDFAQRINQIAAAAEKWDIVLCTDLMNAAELKGLAKPIRDVPLVVYFHENQFAYPIRGKQQPDHHFLFTNYVSALAANSVWLNSRFNRDSFLNGLREHSESWPDMSCTAIDEIFEKSEIVPPPIDCNFATTETDQFLADRKTRVESGVPLHIAWAARWEYDKNPEALLKCLELLKQQKVPFQISVIGENPDKTPAAIHKIKETFADSIQHWGYQESRTDYWSVLESADIFVSTATHEFFGLSVAEAISAGAWPLLPNRLSYPELLAVNDEPTRADLFMYQQNAKQLAAKIRQLHLDRNWDWNHLRTLTSRVHDRFSFDVCVPAMDDLLLKSIDRFDSLG